MWLRRRSATAWLGRTLFWSALLRRCWLALGLGCSAVAWLGRTLSWRALLGFYRLALGLGCSAAGRFRRAFFRGTLLRFYRLALGLGCSTVARLGRAFFRDALGRGTRFALSTRTRRGRFSRMTLIRTGRLLLIRGLRAGPAGSRALRGRCGAVGHLLSLWGSRTIAGGRGCTRLFGRHGRRMIWGSGSLGSYYAASAEYARLCRGGHGGCTVIV